MIYDFVIFDYLLKIEPFLTDAIEPKKPEGGDSVLKSMNL